MKIIKNVVASIAIVGVLSASGIAYASSIKTPAEIVSDLTGKSVESLYSQRVEGKTYGQIANDSGTFEEFKKEMLEQKKIILNERVQDGSLTQVEADEIYKNIQENQENCDGTGSAAIGQTFNSNFRMGNGMGNGIGRGGRLNN